MEPQREKDPLAVWTRPAYREQIDECLNCTKPHCHGNCTFHSGQTKATRRLVEVDAASIRELMKQQGYRSAASLSRACGFSTTVAQVALKSGVISFYSAKIIAKTLRVPVTEILRKDERRA